MSLSRVYQKNELDSVTTAKTSVCDFAMEFAQDAAMVAALGGDMDHSAFLSEFESGDYDNDVMGFDHNDERDENDNESEESVKV